MWKVIILVLLLSVLMGMFAYKYLSSMPSDTVIVPQADKKIVSASDQRPGTSALIESVFLAREGYVVIYDNDNGRFGNIIGNSRVLPAGESLNLNIALTRPTVNGEILFAMLHEDNGDGAFYPTIDVPLRDQDGNILYTFFSVNQNASGPSIINP